MKNLHASPSTDIINEDGSLDRIPSLALRLHAEMRVPIRVKKLKQFSDKFRESFTLKEFDAALSLLVKAGKAICLNGVWSQRKTKKV